MEWGGGGLIGVELKGFGKKEKKYEVKEWQNKEKQMGKDEGQIRLRSLSKCDDISNLQTVIAPLLKVQGNILKLREKKKKKKRMKKKK